MTETDYFDSSALVKRYLSEFGSTWVQNRCNDPNQAIAIADIGRVEVAAAFASKWRSGAITRIEYQEAKTDLAADAQSQYYLSPVTPERIDEAIELTTRHKLRGYDAVHLACALHLNESIITSGLSPLVFVSADADLLLAAQAEGLLVENPNLYP